MDISSDFLYGLATAIGIITIMVAIYGKIWKVPIASILAVLAGFREFVLQEAAKAKAKEATEADEQSIANVSGTEVSNNKEKVLP